VQYERIQRDHSGEYHSVTHNIKIKSPPYNNLCTLDPVRSLITIMKFDNMANQTALSCKTAYTAGTTELGLLVTFKFHMTSPVSLVFIYTSTTQAWKIHLTSYTWPTLHFGLIFNSSSAIHDLTQCVSCILMINYAFQKAWNNTENRYIHGLQNINKKVCFVTSYLLESWGRQEGLFTFTLSYAICLYDIRSIPFTV